MFEPARADDATAVATLRRAAARNLATRFGEGIWSVTNDSPDGVRIEVSAGNTFVARLDGAVVATLRLSPHNPWVGPTEFFGPCARPLFLSAMAVRPEHQRRGCGRWCLTEAEAIARQRHADVIRLDAHDAPAGAGEFYRKCGYREVHRGNYHGTPLIWFERRLA